MYTYEQKSGRLLKDGEFISVGGSGYEEGFNNPDMEDVPFKGPIPRGEYTLGEAFTHPHLGPVVMALTPNEGTETFGRSGFFMHGYGALGMKESSHGCILMVRLVREGIARGVLDGDNQLTVV